MENYYIRGIELKKLAECGGNLPSISPDEAYSKSIINFMNILSLKDEKFPDCDKETYHSMSLKNLEEIARTLGHKEVLGGLRYLIGDFCRGKPLSIKI